MQIKQWEDKNLSHFSYGVLSDCEKKIVLIDPARNPEPYLKWAKENSAEIVAIIETHPHADFVSSHLELSKTTGATIYVHSMVGVSYPHTPFDEGSVIEIGKIKLTSLHTPGHSPDSISILLEHDGKQKAVFTGDTLFIGDCGRPDLREGAGNIQSKREDLAKQMYHSLREKLMNLDDDVLVYPAHGAGSLCGKNLSKENVSTIGKEKQTNWCLQNATEEEFVKNLLTDQPFIPHYFPFDVELNREGAPNFRQSISKPNPRNEGSADVAHATLIIDGRDEREYKSSHLPNSINLMEKGKFETWLGSIVKPGEPILIAGEDEEQISRLLERTAAIGYERQVKGTVLPGTGNVKQEPIDLEKFRKDPDAYTIIDVRNRPEVKEGKKFKHSISIPLAEIRERLNEIPTDKPVVVHCAAGYRSAAGSSIIKNAMNGTLKVYDLGEAIKQF